MRRVKHRLPCSFTWTADDILPRRHLCYGCQGAVRDYMRFQQHSHFTISPSSFLEVAWHLCFIALIMLISSAQDSRWRNFICNCVLRCNIHRSCCCAVIIKIPAKILNSTLWSKPLMLGFTFPHGCILAADSLNKQRPQTDDLQYRLHIKKHVSRCHAGCF